MARMLVIDDEALVRKTIRLALERAGHQVFEAQNGLVGMEALSAQQFDLVITDILMPEREGIETICALRNSGSSIKILAISGGGRRNNMDYPTAAARLGADDTLEKPFELAVLVSKVAQLCQ